MDKRKQIENIQSAFTQLGDVMIRTADAEIMTSAISKIRAVGHALQVEMGKELRAETSNGHDEGEQPETAING